MRKSVKNFVIGAVMAATALTASSAAFAGQFVQTTMNFRSGASKTSASIGSVPVGAEVDVLGSVNDWDLVSYNGKTGYIHAGNLSSTKPQVQAPAKAQNNFSSTQSYFDNRLTLFILSADRETSLQATSKKAKRRESMQLAWALFT